MIKEAERAIRSQLPTVCAASGFAGALAYAIVCFFHLPRNPMMAPTIWIALAIPVFVFLAVIAPKGRSPVFRRIALAAFGLTVVTTLPFSFTEAAFSTRDVNAVLMTARENRLGEMASIGLSSFRVELIAHLAALAALLLGACVLTRSVRHAVPALAVISAVILWYSPVTRFAYRQLVPNPAFALIDPQRDVRTPIIVARPIERKNLVIVYLESIEKTYGDMPATHDAFAPFLRIEQAGLSANGVGQLFGTGFTIAGQVASQCGVPLYSRGVFHTRSKARGAFDNGIDFSDFLTGTTCLGDVLTNDGYIASYMNGSDLEVFSKGDFFSAHGYSRLFGRESLPNLASESRTNLWGLNDEVLFEQAKIELAWLGRSGQPFVLSLLTLSTHGPGAMPDRSCAYPVGELGELPAAIRCTGDNVEDLIAEVARLGLSKNTVIAVMSDHLAMKNGLSGEIRDFVAGGGTRRDYFVLLGSELSGAIDKPATTVDIYPTLLEALGYRLADGRANMGVSLLSDGPTMRQSMGLGTLNAALDGNTRLQEYLWERQSRGGKTAVLLAQK
ncbi:MAG: sulfatase-like hydrolase/transferase [Paracoccaceae bacterium]